MSAAKRSIVDGFGTGALFEPDTPPVSWWVRDVACTTSGAVQSVSAEVKLLSLVRVAGAILPPTAPLPPLGVLSAGAMLPPLGFLSEGAISQCTVVPGIGLGFCTTRALGSSRVSSGWEDTARVRAEGSLMDLECCRISAAGETADLPESEVLPGNTSSDLSFVSV